MIRVLIVDDDEQERTFLGQYLEAKRYACSLAANAAEGRQLLRREKFNLILSDLNMPGESGLEFLQWALSTNPETAGLMMTGMLTPEIVEKATAIGAYCCMAKPIPLDRLLVNMSDALRRGHKSQL
ncbi:MAG: response regulator [Syntrophobacteraceae bacterium]